MVSIERACTTWLAYCLEVTAPRDFEMAALTGSGGVTGIASSGAHCEPDLTSYSTVIAAVVR